MDAGPPTRLQRGQMLDLLSALVEKSLVVYESDAASGEGTYRLLETMREYGRERLRESGEAGTFGSRHCDEFLRLAQQAEREHNGSEQAAWLRRLEQQHDNMRAALAHCAHDEGDPQTGLRLAASLGWFWTVRGYLSEGRRWFAGALERPGADAPTTARAAALNGAGVLAFDQGDLETARALWQESLDLRRALGSSRRGISAALNNLAIVALEQNDYPAATRLFEEALAINKRDNHAHGVAVQLLNLGCVAQAQQDWETAIAYLSASLADLRAQNNPAAMARALLALGECCLGQNNAPAARPLLGECLEITGELGDRLTGAFALAAVAALLRGEQRPEQAAVLLGAAEALGEALGAQLSPNERARRDQIVAATRSACLNEADFVRGHATGRALTWENAAAFARAALNAEENAEQRQGN